MIRNIHFAISLVIHTNELTGSKNAGDVDERRMWAEHGACRGEVALIQMIIRNSRNSGHTGEKGVHPEAWDVGYADVEHQLVARLVHVLPDGEEAWNVEHLNVTICTEMGSALGTT